MSQQRLMDRVRQTIRLKHYSYRTEVTAHILLARFISPLLQPSKTVAKNSEDGVLPIKYEQLRTEESYCHWIKAYIRFHKYCHPEQMGAEQVTEFLTWLAVHKQVSANTQNLALSSVLFLYRNGHGSNPVNTFASVAGFR